MLEHTLFATISWILLIIILYSRPLADIFRLRWLFILLRYRRQLGIASGVFAMLHIGFYLWGNAYFFSYLSEPSFLKWDNFILWGILAFIALLLPFLTSNNFSQRILKKKWKMLQNFSYLAFIFVGIHTWLVQEDVLFTLVPVFVWGVLWFWAYRKKRR
jgi:sulfoxide reductase heme-binding subunit YedZ